MDKMKMCLFKIQIDKDITDENFMEYCLNVKASGYDPQAVIVFYCLGKRWHINKLLFLQKELNEIRNKDG